MSYAIRNSLLLCGLLILSLSMGLYWIGVQQPNLIATLKTQEQTYQNDLKKINAVLSLYESTQATLDSLTLSWQNQQQIVPPHNTSAQTLSYLNTLAHKARSSVNFSFYFKTRQDYAHHSENQYAIEGDARFQDLYTFIWHLEHGRPFYTVDQLELIYQEPNVNMPTWQWIHFKMILRAYFAPQSAISDQMFAKKIHMPKTHVHNPFRPHITQTLPENKRGLFEVAGAKLKGLTQTQAYLEDQAGHLLLLQEGDRVFLGRLDQIDIQNNQVEFVLNKGGIWERQILTAELHPIQHP